MSGISIQDLAWMGDATQEKAMEKRATFYVKIDYTETDKD